MLYKTYNITDIWNIDSHDNIQENLGHLHS